jgi:hypothetical protein
MGAWWAELDGLTRGMFYGAAFFSVIFVWQLLAALFGFSGDGAEMGGLDAVDGFDGLDGADAAAGDGMDSALESGLAFQLLSFRSIVAFLTLFTWGSGLYLSQGRSRAAALGMATAWGLAGMVGVALLMRWMLGLTHVGTKRLSSCVGSRATVYMDIPAGGTGQVRATVSGVLSHVDARTADGGALKAGTPVKIVKLLDQRTVQIEAIKAGEDTQC